MTVVNPKSISGINSITMASGSDDLLTIHSNNTTERVRVNNSGDVIIGSGVTLSPDGDVFATGITTISENLKVGTGVTISPDGDAFFTGVCTATTFKGDGSQLSNVTSTTINNNADNRLITGSGTANTLEGETGLTFDGTTLTVAGASNATQAIFSGTGGSGARGLSITTESVGAADEGVILNARASGTTGRIKLQTNGANCLTLAGNGGDVTVNAGNLVIGVGGKGIDFSATGDGAGGVSSVAEILDDYEEGLFTPYMAYTTTQNDFAYSTQVGQYVKIGKLVTFQARVNLTSAGTGSGNVKMTNLPFAPSPSSGGLSNPMVTVKPVVGVDVGGDREIFAQFEGGNSALVLYTFAIESSSDYSSFTSSNIDNDAQVAFFGHYYTDS